MIKKVENTMRPEMLYTINEYDPNTPDDPMTKAWDDTQSQVLFLFYTFIRCRKTPYDTYSC